MHSPPLLLPSAVPSFTPVPHRPIDLLGVTPFTRPGELWCCVAEQWTGVGKSCGQRTPACGPPVDNVDQGLWTAAVSTVCGDRSATNPQAADLPGLPRDQGACGPVLDNFPVPRLWREDRPLICGEAPPTAGYSNTPRPAARCERGSAGEVETLRRLPEGASPRPARRSSEASRRLAGSWSGPPVALRADPRRAGRPARLAGPSEARAASGRARKRRGRPGTRSPGALAGRPCQPFLMRLVSSVTWL